MDNLSKGDSLTVPRTDADSPVTSYEDLLNADLAEYIAHLKKRSVAQSVIRERRISIKEFIQFTAQRH